MILRPLLALSLLASVALADDDFPGLKQVMTPSEWAHSGLDELTPDQLAIVDSALTRHYAHTIDQAARDATARALAAAQARADQLAKDSGAPKSNVGWSNFGLTDLHSDWRSEPILKSKAVKWVGTNSFLLANNQVWEGYQRIPYDVPGHDIEIQPRPFGDFDLVIDGKDTRILMKRIQ